MKKLIFLSLVLFSVTSMAQLALTKAEIVKTFGYDYESGVTNDDTPYILYKRPMETAQSGVYTQFKVIYFFTASTGETICYLWKIVEPSSETNSNVSHYNRKYVKTGNMEWKDYETGVVYSIEVSDGLCIISAWLESND